MKYLLILALILASCGKDINNIANMSQQVKCDKTVYVREDNTVYLVPGSFEKACKLGASGKETWNRMYRSGSDYTCGFWIGSDNKLITDLNKELTLDTTQYGNCL